MPIVFVHVRGFEVLQPFYVAETLGKAGEAVQVGVAIVEIGLFGKNQNDMRTRSLRARRSAGLVSASVRVAVEPVILLAVAELFFGLSLVIIFRGRSEVVGILVVLMQTTFVPGCCPPIVHSASAEFGLVAVPMTVVDFLSYIVSPEFIPEIGSSGRRGATPVAVATEVLHRGGQSAVLVPTRGGSVSCPIGGA